jgi:hypothetical protein
MCGQSLSECASFAYTDNENVRPEPFRVRFIRRSDAVRKLLLDEAAEAREALRIYDGETRVTMDDAANNPAKR